MASDKSILGSCGEHFVAAYLARAGLIVSLPRAGVRGSDLFVGSPDGGHPIRVQVKTGTQSYVKSKKHGTYYLWQTSLKVADIRDDSMWFAYVWLNEWQTTANNFPEVFFVPCQYVAKVMDAERNATRPYFSLSEAEAQNYKNQIGLKLLLTALPQVSPPLA